MLDVSRLGFLSAQKFAPGGQVEKELSHFDARAGRSASSFDFNNFPSIDDDLRAFDRFRLEFRVYAARAVRTA
jgi:hypothetical protein